MALHYGLVDGNLYTVSGDVSPHIQAGQGPGNYLLKFDFSVEAFVGAAHGNGEGCNSRSHMLTASIDGGDQNKVCGHIFRVYSNNPIGPPENADFSFVVALRD